MKKQFPLFSLFTAMITIVLAACAPSAQASPTGSRIPIPSIGIDTAPAPSMTFTPSATSEPLRCYMVTVVSTSTAPKDAILQPGTPFTPTWRLKNLGSCEWTSDFKLVFDHGDPMSESREWPLSMGTVPPGSVLSASVKLTAPKAEGTFQAFFTIQAADGTIFGTGPNADSAFGIKITVLNGTSIVQSYTPSFTLSPTLDLSAPLAAFKYIEDISVPDGWEVGPDTVFTKTWRVQNIGLEDVGNSSLLVFDYGDRMDAPPVQPLLPEGESADTGDMFELSVDLISPSSPGDYQAFFKIFVFHGPGSRNGSFAAIKLWAKIHVIAPTPAPPGGPATQIVFNQSSVASGNTYSVSAACPPGTVITGGGFSSFLNGKIDPLDAYDSDARIFSSRKKGNGWTVSGMNNWVSYDNPETPGGAVILRVFAVCLMDSAARTTEVEKTVSLPKGRESGGAAALCPEGSVVTGGGFSGKDFSFTVSVQSDNGWHVSAEKIPEGVSEFSAYAICLSGVSGKSELITAVRSFPFEYSGFAQATCPAGSTLTGGGFLSNMFLDDASIHGRSWVVHARNMNYSNPIVPIEAYAMCLTLR